MKKWASKIHQRNWNLAHHVGEWKEDRLEFAHVIYAYQTTYKMTTCHTSFQLVYGLHPLMHIKYQLPITPSSIKLSIELVRPLKNLSTWNLDIKMKSNIFLLKRIWNSNSKVRIFLWKTNRPHVRSMKF